MSGDASQVLTTWPEDMATIPRVADAMASEQSQRITMDKVLRRLYFNLPLTQVLQPQAGTNSTAYREMGAFGLLGRLGYNITRLVVDAAIATVCKRLKCEVTPNGGDFKTERSCRDMSAFVTAIMDASGYWDRFATVGARDGMISSLGPILFYVDGASGEIRCEAIDPLDMLYSASEGMDPFTVMILRALPRVGLLAQFPQHADKIKAATEYQRPSVVGVEYPGSQRGDTIKVIHAWRRRAGKKDGIFSTVLSDGTVLEKKPYKHDFFPFAVYRYDWDSKGFGGYAGARITADYHIACAKLLENAYRGLEGAVPTVLKHINDKSEQRLSKSPWREHYYEHQKPDVFLPHTVAPEALAQIQKNVDMAFLAFGMNQNAAAGTRPAGLDSLPSQREWRDIKNERLARQIANWESMATQAARIIVALASDAYQDKELAVTAPGTDFIRMIKWPKDLREDQYKIKFSQSSNLSETLAGRKQDLAELRDRGSITEAEYVRALGVSDLRTMSNRISGPGDLVSKQISDALDDCIMSMPDPIQGPGGLQMLVNVGSQEYQRAKASGMYPPENLECLRILVLNAEARLNRVAAKPMAPIMPVPGVMPGQPASVAPMASSVLPPAPPISTPVPPAETVTPL